MSEVGLGTHHGSEVYDDDGWPAEDVVKSVLDEREGGHVVREEGEEVGEGVVW